MSFSALFAGIRVLKMWYLNNKARSGGVAQSVRETNGNCYVVNLIPTVPRCKKLNASGGETQWIKT